MGALRDRRVQHAAERSRRERHCGNKRYFHDDVQAYAVLLDIKARHPDWHTLHMYRCHECHGFHHGNGSQTIWEHRMGKETEPQLEVRRTKIAPAIAKQMLRKNTMNRPLSPTLVNYYAADMRAGKWCLAGDTIKLAPDGTLLDGQHRLQAIIDAGFPVEMLVAHNVSKTAMPVIDVGKNRTFSQQLAIQGMENAAKVGAVAKVAYIGHHGSLGNLTSPEFLPTKQQLHAFLIDHPELSGIVKDLHAFRLLPTSLAGGLYFLFLQKDAVATDMFFSALQSGENLSRDNPVYVLREKLLEYKEQRIKLQVTHKDLAAWTIKAWNAQRQGKIIRPAALRWTRNGKAKEEFPEIL